MVTPIGGQGRIPIEEISRLRRQGEGKQRTERCVLYARVSGGRQEQGGNLARQGARLKEAVTKRDYEVVQVIAEQACSLNERLRGMNELLDRLGGQAGALGETAAHI